ncbi:signal peptidase [Tabrizicola piscis]|uniref:Signal peptidase n=1 Tax=Tabrizicola piscis TaxID=2494374 RepID=A0A3S8U734_9RHOB|nr:imelysin family protein [Tabrizicola piscis]AZL59502.1 signal peptidase [Tabrizicola piscis]
MRALILALLLATAAEADTANVVQTHIRPGYAAFAAATNNFAALDSCDPATLRPAFHAAYDAWLGVAHLSQGPAEEEGRALAILFWPDPKALGWKAQRALLAGSPDSLTLEAMSDQSVAARGLSGLERLLYPTDPLPADPCPLIHATAEDLARMARDLVIEWGPYGDLLLTAGQPDNPRFLTKDEATQALFTQLITGLDYIADRRLGRPLGTFDKPRPDLAEARASDRSLRNVILSLQALRDLALQLTPESPRTLAAFVQTLLLANELSDPSFAHITDPQAWLKLQILQQSIRTIRDAALAEIGPALGVTLGFNAQDGD